MIEKELEQLIGQELRDVLQVLASVGGEKLRQIGTVVFATESGGAQLHGGVREARLRPMSSPKDVRVDGDYDEGEGVELRSLGLLPFPVRIAQLHTVHELVSGKERLIGAIFTDDCGASRFAINLHWDEPRVVSSESLWGYVLRLMPNSTRIIVRRVPGPQAGAALQTPQADPAQESP